MGLLWVLLAAFLLPPIALAGLGLLLIGAAISAGLFGHLVRSLRIPLALVASILVVNALFYPGGEGILFGLGPIRLTVEGLTFGIVSAGRILIAFMASILFLVTTLADDLLEALVARGVSHRVAFVMLSAVQLVPRLQARAVAIMDAQQSRGLSLGGSVRSRLRALVPLVGPILLGSLIEVRERTFALEARAFGARAGRTAYRTVPDPAADRWLRLGIVAAMLVVVGVTVAGAGH
jgi:energy-coupling factor transport system permease protein